jgi:hypothetical protein
VVANIGGTSVTTAETIELAQVSVEQIQRGLSTAQDRLDNAEALIDVADKVVENVDRVVENVTIQARRMPRRMLICGAVAAVCGIALIVIIKKRKQAESDQATEEILT